MRNQLMAAGWNYEGQEWRAPAKSNTPVYRLYNPNAAAGSHHYTASEEEHDNLINMGWQYEGIAWHGMK